MITQTLDDFISEKLDSDLAHESSYKQIIIEAPKSGKKLSVELYNCSESYMRTVKKIICIHPANHSVSMFLTMKDQADMAMYCHPLLSTEASKNFVIEYTQRYNYPLAIITRLENIDEVMRKNGAPTMFRRWCTRIFKIEASRYFYRKFFNSGVIEFQGIQRHQSKTRAEMIPSLVEDPKSQKTFKIFRELPIYEHSEEWNLEIMAKHNIEPFSKSVRSANRYGCFLCPYAGEQYYVDLKANDPETYNECCRLMEIASENKEERYYYYRKSKIM
jgi:hypothetical protein